MIITVASNKGGVGKTTTAVSVAAGLNDHRRNKEILLVDLDAQGHAAIALGRDTRQGVFDWLCSGHSLGDTAIEPRTGLHVVPGNSTSNAIEAWYRSEPGGFERLIARLRDTAERFDDIVIDTPAAGMLQEAALAAADLVVIPWRPDHLGTDGMLATLALRDQLAKAQHLAGCAREILLPTAIYRRASEHRWQMADVRAQYGDLVADPVPHRIAVAEAVAAGQTIWEYRNRGLADVRLAYTQLLQRILDPRQTQCQTVKEA